EDRPTRHRADRAHRGEHRSRDWISHDDRTDRRGGDRQRRSGARPAIVPCSQMNDIAHSWSPLLDGLDALLPELAAHYCEPHRAYHGVDHIAALAKLFVEVDRGPGWRAPLEVRLAILFHDAIYE